MKNLQIANEKQLVKGIVKAKNRLLRSSVKKDRAISDFKEMCISNGLDPDSTMLEMRKTNQNSPDIETNDYVYFISAGDYIKIGKTSGESPLARLATLQTANPLTLKMEAFFIGGIKDEKKLHGKFKHLHVRGEWFKFDSELKRFIQTIEGELA